MARILLLSAHDENRRILRDWLAASTDHDPVMPTSSSPFAVPFDICIIDGTAIQRYAEDIEQAKAAAAPVFLPFLLLIAREDALRVEADFWEHADDIAFQQLDETISTPIAKFELTGRIRSLVMLREMSQRLATSNERLRVLNRVLRHNLRNDLNVVEGQMNLVKAAVEDRELKASLQTATEAVHDLLEIGSKVQRLNDRLDDMKGESGQTQVEIGDILHQVETDFTESHPEAAITVDGPEEPISLDHRCKDVLTELVENAIQHNDEPTPEVTIEASGSERGCEIRVIDNGPGIPAMEWKSLQTGAVSPLEHASSIGLWVAKWLVEDFGGTLSITDAEPRGAIVTITIPETG